MNIAIEKISNGYVLTIGSKKTFCDVPEAVCGSMAEWVLEECKRLNAPQVQENSVDILKLYANMVLAEQAQKQASIPPPWHSTCSLDPK